MVKREMRDKENLYEALRIIKDARQTNFKKEYVNPWENQNLTIAKLISVDFDQRVAEVKTTSKTTVLIKMDDTQLETLNEIGNYYGITSFLDNNGNMVDYSYITKDMLTPVRTIGNGVDVYE